MKANVMHAIKPVLSQSILIMLAVIAGISVANLYYLQPLLAEISLSFKVDPTVVGIGAMLTQAGYALGMLFILPLADIRNKKFLICTVCLLAGVIMLIIGWSHSLWIFLPATLLLGIFSVTPQLIVPLGVELAQPEERGRVIGQIMSGLFIGILLSRTVSGIIGEHFGWQSVYWLAAVLMLVIVGVIIFKLPNYHQPQELKYSQLFTSIFKIAAQEPVLREAAINGALMFAVFSIFWTCLPFWLASPVYNLGPQTVGIFGLVGVVGIIAAPIAGKIADRRSPKITISFSILIVIFAYLCFGFWGKSLIGLVCGVILLDLGVQACQISNQARIFALSDLARNRINTFYMVAYFCGGAGGSWLGAYCYTHWGWTGCSIAGIVILLLATWFNFKGFKVKLAAK
jgi:predicted MFS family arabinose efflux permease